MCEKEIGAEGSAARHRTRGLLRLPLLAVVLIQTGVAQAASGDGPAEMPSALHALALLAVFFVLSGIRVTRQSGKWTVRFELSPVPPVRATERRKKMGGL